MVGNERKGGGGNARWPEARERCGAQTCAPTVVITKAGLCCKSVANSSTSHRRVIGGAGEHGGSLWSGRGALRLSKGTVTFHSNFTLLGEVTNKVTTYRKMVRMAPLSKCDGWRH